MHAHRIPAALARTGSRIVANGAQNPEVMFRELRTAVQAHIDRQGDQMDNITAALDAVQQQVNGGAGAGGGSHILPVDPSYTSAFASYFRKGGSEDALKAANAVGDRALVQAAMSAGDNSSGGYLAPVEWDRKLQERQRATSPMRRLATVQSTTVGAFSTLWNADTWGSGWVGETAARPLTTSSTLAPVNFAAGEIYAQPSVTQRLLDDSAINIDNWLVQSVETRVQPAGEHRLPVRRRDQQARRVPQLRDGRHARSVAPRRSGDRDDGGDYVRRAERLYVQPRRALSPERDLAHVEPHGGVYRPHQGRRWSPDMAGECAGGSARDLAGPSGGD